MHPDEVDRQVLAVAKRLWGGLGQPDVHTAQIRAQLPAISETLIEDSLRRMAGQGLIEIYAQGNTQPQVTFIY